MVVALFRQSLAWARLGSAWPTNELTVVALVYTMCRPFLLWVVTVRPIPLMNSLKAAVLLVPSVIDAGEVEPGVALLRRILAKDPEAPMVHYNLGVYEVLEGR